MITYPTNRLLAVIDDPARAAAAGDALTAAGMGRDHVEVLVGADGRDRLGRLGSRPNLLSRTVRAFQFMLMDQMPDFLVYERAIDDGRAVVAVRVDDRRVMREAQAVLERHGGHFLNHFGRFSTEELTMWRGPEPVIPDPLRR